MIYGIGVDMVRISRIRAGLERFGNRFARRILSTSELSEFAEHTQAGRRARFLAKHFAAKEAAAKALGTGFRDGLTLRHIAVVHDSLGKPLLHYSGRATQMLEVRQIDSSHLSITDEDDHAVAFVTLVTRA